jgi:hypothetical protein
MLQAMLHHKLTREEESMEDLLTSNTFGLMKYLPYEMALLPFLRKAWDPLRAYPDNWSVVITPWCSCA